jgi:hypothetical protein
LFSGHIQFEEVHCNEVTVLERIAAILPLKVRTAYRRRRCTAVFDGIDADGAAGEGIIVTEPELVRC